MRYAAVRMEPLVTLGRFSATLALLKPAYSVENFCLAFDIGRSKVFEEISAGRLKAHKAGTRTIIALEDGIAWLNALPLVETGQTRNPSLSPKSLSGTGGPKQRSLPPTCVLIIPMIAQALDWWMHVAQGTFVSQVYFKGPPLAYLVVLNLFS